jgi:hypothetical protein
VSPEPQPEKKPEPDKKKTLKVENNGTPKGQAIAPADPGRPRTKAERLAELLQAYKADKITPFEYHSERAKILADPNP